MTRLLAILFLTSCLTSTVVAADIDLSQSKITPEADKVPGGTMVTVNVVLKNTGDKPSDGTDLTISFPQNGFFMRIDELPELKRNDDEREVTARLNIPAGEEYRFAFVLLAPRSEVGKNLSMHIEVRNLLADSLAAARWNSDVSVKITSVPTTEGIVIGGLRFYPAAGWLLGWMVCGGLMFLWIRARLQWVREHPQCSVVPLPADVRRMSAFGLVSLVMFPLAFMMVAGGMAWRDLQTLTSWKEAQATILDRREVVKTSSDNRPGQQRRTSSTHTPEFALKYHAGEREVISTGFVTGWTIHIGGQVTGKADMNDWVPGKTIPCWYDPADPGNVVVRRGFGIANLFFGLLPLPILWFALRQLRKLSNAVRRLEEREVLEEFTQ
ncbi:MAG: DUF3592 domain-containing protein [Planctomycetota bacterium]